MLDKLKYLINYKSIDKDISENNFEIALSKLNQLIQDEYKPAETFLKRGQLCHKLLMLEDAYSDFTYVITHCVNKIKAYKERCLLNYELSNFSEAISDSNIILETNPNDQEAIRIKFLSLAFISELDFAKEYILSIYSSDKYKTLQYLFNEVATFIANNELAKALKILAIIDLIDKDNPIKLLNEATIYEQAGNIEKKNEIIKNIDSAFPKYFISHFRFSDMYQEKDLMEICFLIELKYFDKQNLFAYPISILEGYKNYIEGHIIDAKESFEKTISINPNKPEGYILLAQTLQLMSGYDQPIFLNEAKNNYQKALKIYEKENLYDKAENMRRQLKHINSNSKIYS